MDNLVFLVYLITRLDTIISMLGGFQFVFIMLGLIATVVTIIYFLANGKNIDEYTSDVPKVVESNKVLWTSLRLPRRIGIGLLVIGILITLVKNLLPSKEDAMYIAGTYAAVQLAKTDTAQKMGKESTEIVMKFLEKTRIQLDKDVEDLKAPAKETKEPEAPEVAEPTKPKAKPVLTDEDMALITEFAKQKARAVVESQVVK